MTDNTPDSYHWEFTDDHGRQSTIHIQRRRWGTDQPWVVTVHVNGDCCNGSLTVPLSLWQTLLTATFTPPVTAAPSQTVTVRLETAPIRVETVSPPPPTPPKADPIEEARKNLDRPIYRG